MYSLLYYYNSEQHIMHDIAGRLKQIVREYNQNLVQIALLETNDKTKNTTITRKLNYQLFKEYTQRDISQPYIVIIL